VKKIVVPAVLLALLVCGLPASAATPRILAAQDQWPTWSPDGSKIAFTRIATGVMRLEVLDLRTGHVSELAQNRYQLHPTWSPDGSRLAYQADGHVYVTGPSGGERVEIGAMGKGATPKLFTPVWSPTTDKVAFLTTLGPTNLDLWTGDAGGIQSGLRAKNVIGVPAWSPTQADHLLLVFQRDDGLYLTTGERLVAVANPGPPAWSHDGTRIAYTARGTLYEVAADGSTPPVVRARNLVDAGAPVWSFDDARLAVPTRGNAWVQGTHVTVGGLGLTWAPRSNVLVGSGARGDCPGHVALRQTGLTGGPLRTLTGSCLITGTARADVIEGTPLGGDAIQGLAGNDRIHANDGHTDRVNCGAGRDTVWADRTDRLSGCEVIYH
jgi:dipeptidyl aminopeptidase/acylaminoacyl peptidase